MLLLLSPSKTQTLQTRDYSDFTIPAFKNKTNQLVNILQKHTIRELATLMKMSDVLAELNFERYQNFTFPSSPKTARQAIFVFQGDVYDGIETDQYSRDDLEFAQNHLRVLSGLYGVLRPLDLILPYRLEMGLKMDTGKGKNLYHFWKSTVTEQINQDSKGQPIINLASNEYFKVLDKKELSSEVITPVFKEVTSKGIKTVAIYAKRIRGKMTDFVIRNQMGNPEKLKEFDLDGYQYNEEFSNSKEFVFTRNHL